MCAQGFSQLWEHCHRNIAAVSKPKKSHLRLEKLSFTGNRHVVLGIARLLWLYRWRHVAHSHRRMAETSLTHTCNDRLDWVGLAYQNHCWSHEQWLGTREEGIRGWTFLTLKKTGCFFHATLPNNPDGQKHRSIEWIRTLVAELILAGNFDAVIATPPVLSENN